MNTQLTNTELYVVQQYIGSWYADINCLMDSGINSEMAYPLGKVPSFFEDEATLDRVIKFNEILYSAMIKTTINTPSNEQLLYRGTNTVEVEYINNSKNVNKFLSTTSDYNEAEEIFSNSKQGDPATLVIHAKGIPFINVGTIIKDYDHSKEQEIILAPYSKVNSLNLTDNNDKIQTFDIVIEKCEYTYLAEQETIFLKTEISNNLITARNSCYRAIRAKKDQNEITNLLKSGSDEFTPEQLNVFLNKAIEEYKNNIEIYDTWKQMIAKYLQSSFRKIEHDLGYNIINNIETINTDYVTPVQNSEANKEPSLDSSSKEGLPTEGIFKV